MRTRAMNHAPRLATTAALIVLLMIVMMARPSHAFLAHGRETTAVRSRLSLQAKKAKPKPKKKGMNASSSGFGGAAAAPCPCGSGLGYAKCCGKLHKDPKAFASATAEQRARYSAYGKREVDFIVGSTHPLNKGFMSDIEHWKEQIRINCYDNFILNSCEIVEEEYEGEGDSQTAKVKFVAKMTQVDSREKSAFMETSTFERAGKHIANGAWLYKEGVIETAPGFPDAQEEDEESDDDDSAVPEAQAAEPKTVA